MNDLETFFYDTDHRLCHKWKHYFEIYERYFYSFRGKSMNILEIGVSHGGSIQMWLDYFGLGCTYYGIDIDPQVKQFESEDVNIYIGSQDDRKFLSEIANTLPYMDIIIDDGGHTMKQQRNTFDELFGLVKYGGIYLCEDTHTSYMRRYGGGGRRSFINFTKKLIDQVHLWYINKEITDYTRSIKAIHYHDSVVVIEKDVIDRPEDIKMGQPIIKDPYVNYYMFGGLGGR